ncbi:hypothetical protein ACQEVS_07180 [Streptomyces sp. CA-181903]|uniref:hypothetical protein n=1 Tax=Streptomyces sp. CA-181903 TaxID=3240055 RepID=UPI003D8D6295
MIRTAIRTAARAAALLLMATTLAGPKPAVAAPAPHQQAECHTRIRNSHATADCYNGNATPDHVQLHLRCAHWWDPAMDTAPATVDPTRHVTLSQRCWLRIREAWVSHSPG